MRSAEQQRIEKEINGCQITLSFSAKPVDGVMDKIQSGDVVVMVLADVYLLLCGNSV